MAQVQRVSGLPHTVVLGRIPAEEPWDVVVTLESAEGCEPAPLYCWWTTKDRLTIELQDRQDHSRVMPLAIEPGPNDDCSTRVERFTIRELVLSCLGEKSSIYDNQKFLYDAGARKLESHFAYAPFSAARVLPGPRFVMADGHRELVVEIDPSSGEPRVTSAAAPAATPETGGFGPGGRFHLSLEKNRYGSEYPVIVEGATTYALPQTGLLRWERDRPNEVKNYSRPDLAEIDEQIGPHQLEGGRLWFGKTFYNAEGMTGVGGFGYFDTATRAYRLITPPEIYAWSVSAILVEADSVWLALDRRGEYGNYPGGLLWWDRKRATVEHWDMPWIAVNMARGGDAIYIGTTDGIAVLRGGRIMSYFVDRSADGRYEMAVRN
jgi:hypothetical protein